MNIRNSLRSQNGMLHSDALLIRISATGISNFTIIKVTKTYNFLLAGQHLGHIAILLTFSSLASQNLIYRIQQYRLLAIGIIFYPAALST